MSLDRRSFFKLFGAGAAIAPMAAGSPIMEAQAVIHKPPKVEAVSAVMPNGGDMISLMTGLEPLDVTVTARERETGKVVMFTAEAHCTHYSAHPEFIDVTTRDIGPWRRKMCTSVRHELSFTFSSEPTILGGK